MRYFKIYLSLFLVSLSMASSFGQGAKDVEIPYTVGDRELILEIKLRLEAHEKAMNDKLEAYQKATDLKLQAINEKLDAYQKANDTRFDFLENLMSAMFAAIMTAIAALAGYLVWTQKRERQLAKQSAQIESLTAAQMQSLVEKVSERLRDDNRFRLL